jgi:hypothetical protein
MRKDGRSSGMRRRQVRCTASHGLWRPGAASIRSERVLKPTKEKRRAPAPAVVTPQLEVVLRAPHAGHAVAYSAPGVEAAMSQAQLALPRIKGEEAKRSAEGGAPVSHHSASIVGKPCRGITRRAAARTSATEGHT